MAQSRNVPSFSRWIASLMLIAMSCTLAAQRDTTTRTLLGVTGGVIVSDVYFIPGVASDVMNSTVLGVAFRHVTNNNLGIHIAAEYAQVGWSTEGYTRTLDVLRIPVLTHVSIGKHRLRPFLVAGETFSFILSESEEQTSEVFQGVDIDHKMQVAVGGGVGFVKLFPFGALQLEARGDYNLTQIFAADHPDLPFQSNNLWTAQVTLAYLHMISGNQRDGE